MRLMWLFALLLCFGCSERQEIIGLWELHKMDVDMIPKRFTPTYLRFAPDGSFFVSKEDGDLVGIYKLDQKLLTLSSKDEKWFDRSWKVFATEQELVLNDVKNSFRGAQMRFRKIDQFPTFDEFLETLSGKWKLYKIEEKGEERRLSRTYLSISEERYELSESDEIVEQGNISIDARHHKITFEQMQITWNVRFVWDDLRLENKELGITYRLRKE